MATRKIELYQTWQQMIYRCTNPNNPAYKWYGARGITVCERWLSFLNFYKDMGKRPKGMTLDRIDNNGDYEPENCRWATGKEQGRNTRANRLFTVDGTTKTLAEWVEVSELKASTIRQRFYVYGWPIEDALFKPLERIRR